MHNFQSMEVHQGRQCLKTCTAHKNIGGRPLSHPCVQGPSGIERHLHADCLRISLHKESDHLHHMRVLQTHQQCSLTHACPQTGLRDNVLLHHVLFITRTRLGDYVAVLAIDVNELVEILVKTATALPEVHQLIRDAGAKLIHEFRHRSELGELQGEAGQGSHDLSKLGINIADFALRLIDRSLGFVLCLCVRLRLIPFFERVLLLFLGGPPFLQRVSHCFVGSEHLRLEHIYECALLLKLGCQRCVLLDDLAEKRRLTLAPLHLSETLRVQLLSRGHGHGVQCLPEVLLCLHRLLHGTELRCEIVELGSILVIFALASFGRPPCPSERNRASVGTELARQLAPQRREALECTGRCFRICRNTAAITAAFVHVVCLQGALHTSTRGG
mmetsp:Transcript_14696/g.36984  ORF Transcript_14696/g.36984 Transcript_14696/m.36984 type:complete len:387 (-) Transcript_14696:479-1639(-)